MNRRKFIAATSVSVGVAGCLTGNGTDDGNDGTESDDTGDASLDANDSADASHSSDPGADGNRNDSDDESATDSSSNESEGSDGDEGNDTDESDGEGETEDESVPSERTTSFESCTRATVSGSFADGDVAFASTGFYDEDGLYGNTIVEDGVVFGDDVTAPFSGTVVFEVGAQAGVSEGSDEIVVTVSDYGSVGTVITSLTTEQTDYAVGSPTTPNPHAEDCLSELESEAGGDGSDGGSDDTENESGDDGNGDSDTDGDGESGNSDGSDGESDAGAEPSLEVSIVRTNSPVDAGDSLEGTVRVENTGGAAGTGSVDLIVGNDPTPVESRSVSLEAGAQTTLTMGYQTPPVASDQQFPVRVETADDSDRQTVRVRGTQ